MSRDSDTVGGDYQAIMTAQELALWGASDLAFVKRVVVDGRAHWAIHSGDGQQLGVAETWAAAIAAIYQYDLDPVSLN